MRTACFLRTNKIFAIKAPNEKMSSLAATTTTTTPPTCSADEQVANLTTALQREKTAKRKMYGYLVKIADELKTLRAESEQLI